MQTQFHLYMVQHYEPTFAAAFQGKSVAVIPSTFSNQNTKFFPFKKINLEHPRYQQEHPQQLCHFRLQHLE